MRLVDEDQKTRAFLKVGGGCLDVTPPRVEVQDHDIFISLIGVLYVVVNSQKDKGKAIKKHILKDIVPRGFNVRIEEIQEKHQQPIKEKDAAIALLNDDVKNHEYKNLSLQGEIVALQRLFSDEDKKNGISIITKNNDEAECPYISICGQHGYRRQKVRVLLTRNKGSTLFADGNTPNAIVIYNFWQEHRLIVVDPDRPRQFRLDMINQEQLLALNNT